MKPVAINEEIIMQENDFIVSKTDTVGKITYCNQIFMSIAGYSESELMGKNHNIIRHPDMPKIAFKIAWDLIQNKKEFFGFVKNMTKTGAYYWVFANITPDVDKSQNIIGYTSVRRKPNTKAIETIIPIYQKLVEQERQGGINASQSFLDNFLNEQQTSYDELILALQGA